MTQIQLATMATKTHDTKVTQITTAEASKTTIEATHKTKSHVLKTGSNLDACADVSALQ